MLFSFWQRPAKNQCSCQLARGAYPWGMDSKHLVAGIQFLAEAGLNLLAVLGVDGLPTAVREQFPADAAGQHLLLVGHGGRALWENLQAWPAFAHTADPIDQYTITHTERFLAEFAGNPPVKWLYPHNDTAVTVPLQKLGALAGWSYPSPLGLGIHPEFGIWFAYRAALLVDAAWAERVSAPQASPCEACVARPCLSACPAGATHPQTFDGIACADHRLRPASSCAATCHARLACPFFTAHRYSAKQMAYHYRHSLETLRVWFG